MAKLLKPFLCVPPGEVYAREIPAGEDCPAGLEENAAALGLFEPGSELDALKDGAKRIVSEMKAEYQKQLNQADEELTKVIASRDDAINRSVELETQLAAANARIAELETAAASATKSSKKSAEA